MKQGDVISQSELLKNGWEQCDCYGDCEIWTKGDERLLWDPTTKKIQIMYQGGI